MSRPQVLICDDDFLFQIEAKRILAPHFDCKIANHGDEALALVKKQSFDVVLLDIHMRTADEGFRFIPLLVEADSDLAIIISSSAGDFQSAKRALQLGATEYIVKNGEEEDLVHTLEQVIYRRSLLKRQQQQNFETSLNHRQTVLIGENPKIRKLLTTTEKIRARPANVLIFGETGTGKEVVARQLRRTLPDGSLAPFLAVDSATIQSSMAESILFGHEKGAFTGADRTSKGLFEAAHQGIVYFDEISNMPLQIQAKLLRVIQEKEVVRLGSSRAIQLEFQVVCATNKNLEEMVVKGEFKDDLLQRLNVIPIQLPPLRERTEDIPLLIEHFTKKGATSQGRLRFTDEAIAALQGYPWPGNVRELENLIDNLTTLADTLEIDWIDLPTRFQGKRTPSGLQLGMDPARVSQTPFYQQIVEFEKTLLTQAYQHHGGNVTRLAAALEMDRSNLHIKLKEYNIHSPRRG